MAESETMLDIINRLLEERGDTLAVLDQKLYTYPLIFESHANYFKQTRYRHPYGKVYFEFVNIFTGLRNISYQSATGDLNRAIQDLYQSLPTDRFNGSTSYSHGGIGTKFDLTIPEIEVDETIGHRIFTTSDLEFFDPEIQARFNNIHLEPVQLPILKEEVNRLIRLRVFPSIDLARISLGYEKGLMEGTLAPDPILSHLQKHITLKQLEALQGGKNPFQNHSKRIRS